MDIIHKRICESTITVESGEMCAAIDEFDFSAYSAEHPLFDGMIQEEIKSHKQRNI